MTAPAAPRAAIYARISMDRDDTEQGVTRQREDGEKLAANRGYEVTGLYTDNDKSASTGQHRPDYERLMAAAGRGEFGVIIVWQLSRLWRNRRERAEGIELLKARGVSVAACKGQDLDLSTSYGRTMADIMGALDTWEGDVKAERVTAAQVRAVEAGRWIGGPRPFGWDLVPDPARKGTKEEHRLVLPVINNAEADEIRRLARDLLEGRSLAALVRDLNERGVRTAWGKSWTPASLRKLLTRPRNYGAGEYEGELYPGTWPAILDEDTVRQIAALLADPSRRTSTGNVVKYLLSGIARCGVEGCGAPVKSASATTRRGTRRRLYKCSAREHLYRSQEMCDLVVVGELLSHLRAMTPENRLRMLAEEDPASPQAAEAARLRAKLAEWADMLSKDETDRATYKRQTAVLRGQLTAAERAMSRVPRAPVVRDLLVAGDVSGAWEAMPLDRQRSAIYELLEVTILPGARPRPGQPLRKDTVGLAIRFTFGRKIEPFGEVQP